MPTLTSSDAVQRFYDVAQIKVWSLLVTAFGDLANEEGATLSGTQLNALFQVMGIKPEAIRVALHRLTKDGWIISQRTGRTSNYRLSSMGLANTTQVWDRVYGPNHGMAAQWHVMVVSTGLVESRACTIKLAPQTYIADNSVLANNPDAMAVPFQSHTAPAWVEAKILSDGLGDLSLSLLDALQYFSGFEPMGNGLDKVAVRVLCLHHWRRIALRHAAWLHIKLYDSGHLRLCHDKTHQLLIDLPRDHAKRLIDDYC